MKKRHTATTTTTTTSTTSSTSTTKFAFTWKINSLIVIYFSILICCCQTSIHSFQMIKMNVQSPNSSSSFATIKLSHRQNFIQHQQQQQHSIDTVPILFLHGLDSSSHTWRRTLQALEEDEAEDDRQYPAVALDLRGCGYSDLGDVNQFHPASIVQDIHEFMLQHEHFRDDDGIIKKFVICGHSMGGRIAMSYAATYPQHIHTLIIEDMDIRTRPMDMNIFQRQILNREETCAFNRTLHFKSDGTQTDALDEIKNVFEIEGYPRNSVDKWLKEGRVTQFKNGNDEDDCINQISSSSSTRTYYSEVNPAFRLLCYEQFFNTNHGEETWKQIAQNTKYTFPCHVMVAGTKGTVCDNTSIWQMQKIMREYGSGDSSGTMSTCATSHLRMILHRYKNATHSIHNSEQNEFIKDLKLLIS